MSISVVFWEVLWQGILDNWLVMVCRMSGHKYEKKHWKVFDLINWSLILWDLHCIFKFRFCEATWNISWILPACSALLPCVLRMSVLFYFLGLILSLWDMVALCMAIVIVCIYSDVMEFSSVCSVSCLQFAIMW